MLRLTLLPLLAGMISQAFASPSASGIRARDDGTFTAMFQLTDADANPPENFRVCGSLAPLGSGNENNSPTMSPSGHTWSLSEPVPAGTSFWYYFLLVEANNTVVYDNCNYTDTTAAAGRSKTFAKTWGQCQDGQDGSSDQSDLLRRGSSTDTVIFTLTVPESAQQPNRNAFVYGDISQLGGGDADRAMTLAPMGNNQYRISMPLPASTEFTYQYYLKNTDGTVINDMAGQRDDTTPSSGTQDLDDTFCTDQANCPASVL